MNAISFSFKGSIGPKIFVISFNFFSHWFVSLHTLLWLRIFLFNLRLNPFTLKLPSLLSQYLREQKTLSLPGIGVFSLTGPVASADDSFTSNIQFQNKKIKEPDDKLINFIKQETGKIKPLAIADLETFIATGMELLNMGKPFQLEGIGSIQKKKDGEYDFVAGESIT